MCGWPLSRAEDQVSVVKMRVCEHALVATFNHSPPPTLHLCLWDRLSESISFGEQEPRLSFMWYKNSVSCMLKKSMFLPWSWVV